MKRVYFVRHGETEGNIGKFFQTSETPLTEKGHLGAKAIGERLRHLKIDAILASPFVRTQQTAGHISEAIAVPVETLQPLHEFMQSAAVRGMQWDCPEGIAYIDARRNHFFDPTWERDGAENHTRVLERVKEAVTFIENHPAQNIVVVSHGQFLALLSTYLLLGKSTDPTTSKTLYGSLHLLSNVAITEFIYTDDAWKLFTWNDRAHFADN